MPVHMSMDVVPGLLGLQVLVGPVEVDVYHLDRAGERLPVLGLGDERQIGAGVDVHLHCAVLIAVEVVVPGAVSVPVRRPAGYGSPAAGSGTPLRSGTLSQGVLFLE